MGEIAVAPLVGAWIETCFKEWAFKNGYVAPLVGAWIETPEAKTQFALVCGRSPRGSVD